MKYQLTLINDIEEIARLAEFVDRICEETGVPPSLSMSLNLALEEAVTNVILYAYPAEEKGTLTVDCELDSQQLVFVITDSGIPFDPTQVADADITLGVEERPMGGLGIFMVREIMDKVTYQRQGDKNILTLTKAVC